MAKESLSVKSIIDTLPETSKAYLAGFFDGEGCIFIKTSNANKTNIPVNGIKFGK